MKFAFIAPSAYLDTVSSQGDMHLVLAQHVLGDPDYWRFYKKEEKYKILDNGAFELGHPMPVEEVLKAADMIGAHEVVAPDVFRDGEATIVSVNNFLYEIGLSCNPNYPKKKEPPTFKIMAVPHGKDFVDWFTCFQHFYNDARVHVIGISYQSCKALKPLWPLEISLSALRVRLIRALTTAFPDKTYHLLGGGTNPIEIVNYKEFPQVRSMDTKLPFVAGMMDQTFDPQTGWVRPGEPVLDFSFEGLTPDRLKKVFNNIGVIKKWAGD